MSKIWTRLYKIWTQFLHNLVHILHNFKQRVYMLIVFYDCLNLIWFIFITIYLIRQEHRMKTNYMHVQFASWEPEGRYQYSKMFRWDTEGCYCCTKSMAVTPFWFSTEQLWIAVTPFWLSADKLWPKFTYTCNQSVYVNSTKKANSPKTFAISINWRVYFQNLINPLLVKIEFLTSLYRSTLEL